MKSFASSFTTLLLALTVAFVSLICTGARCAGAADQRYAGAQADSREPGVTLYRAQLHDSGQIVAFRFYKPQPYGLLAVFMGNGLRSWSVENARGVTPLPVEELRATLTSLRWQTSFASRDESQVLTKIPVHGILPEEVSAIRIVPKGLPTAALSNAFRSDNYWYRQALQAVLASPTPKESEESEFAGYIAEGLEGARETHNFLDLVAEAFEKGAKSGNALASDARFAGVLTRSSQRLLRGKQGTVQGTIENGVPVYELQVGKNTRLIKAEEVAVVLKMAMTIMSKLSLDEQIANHMAGALDAAESGTVDPAFEGEARALIAQANSTRVALGAAMQELLLDDLTNGVIAPRDKITPERLGLWMAKSAPALIARLPVVAAYAPALTFSIAQVSAAVVVADLAFNTGGIYENAKTADFLARSANEFAKLQIQCERNLQMMQPSARLSAWASTIYARQLCVAQFKEQYGDIWQDGRLTRVAAQALREVSRKLGRSDISLAEDIALLHQEAKDIRVEARDWIDPPMTELIALYQPPAGPALPPFVIPTTPTLSVSAPVLVIDRSGSISDVAGVMEQVQNKAEDVVRAIQRNVSGAAVINFSGAGNSAVDTGFTSDSATLLRAIRAPSIGNTGTAIYDAVGRAVEVARTRGERTMMILFTDGKNNQGRGLEEAILGCKAAGVPVVIVGFVGSEGRDEKSLQTLAFSTGGFYVPSESADIAELLERFRFYSQSKAASRIRGSAD